MIIVYFDNDEEGRQGETYFAEQIQRKIYEYTGIKLIPYWHNIQYNTDADFRLDAIKLKYDNEGNVINESENKKDSSVKVFNYKNYTLILSKNPCDVFTHFKVEDLHGLNYQKCLRYKNTKESAYIAGLTNKSPKTKKDFLFLNLNRLGKDKEKMGLIMHETMHLSLELHKHEVNKKEEEIITWAEKEAYKIYDIIKKL
jgi:hypothetical protein